MSTAVVRSRESRHQTFLVSSVDLTGADEMDGFIVVCRQNLSENDVLLNSLEFASIHGYIVHFMERMGQSRLVLQKLMSIFGSTQYSGPSSDLCFRYALLKANKLCPRYTASLDSITTLLLSSITINLMRIVNTRNHTK